MAMLSLLFLVLSLIGLFLTSSIHVALGILFMLAAFAHNWKSRGFYAKCLSGTATERKPGDLILIALIGLSTLLVLVSGLLMLAQVMTPWFFAPWVWMHRIGAAGLVIFSLLHMKQEWS